jgi:hypothetical protein
MGRFRAESLGSDHHSSALVGRPAIQHPLTKGGKQDEQLMLVICLVGQAPAKDAPKLDEFGRVPMPERPRNFPPRYQGTLVTLPRIDRGTAAVPGIEPNTYVSIGSVDAKVRTQRQEVGYQFQIRDLKSQKRIDLFRPLMARRDIALTHWYVDFEDLEEVAAGVWSIRASVKPCFAATADGKLAFVAGEVVEEWSYNELAKRDKQFKFLGLRVIKTPQFRALHALPEPLPEAEGRITAPPKDPVPAEKAPKVETKKQP